MNITREGVLELKKTIQGLNYYECRKFNYALKRNLNKVESNIKTWRTPLSKEKYAQHMLEEVEIYLYMIRPEILPETMRQEDLDAISPIVQ